MPRSTAAYLADIVDACDAVAEVLKRIKQARRSAGGLTGGRRARS